MTEQQTANNQETNNQQENQQPNQQQTKSNNKYVLDEATGEKFEVPAWAYNKIKSSASLHMLSEVRNTGKELLSEALNDFDFDNAKPTEIVRTMARVINGLTAENNKLSEMAKQSQKGVKTNQDDLEKYKAEIEAQSQSIIEKKVQEKLKEIEKQNSINNFIVEARSLAIRDGISEEFADNETFNHFFKKIFEVENVNGQLFVKTSSGDYVNSATEAILLFKENFKNLFKNIQAGQSSKGGVFNNQGQNKKFSEMSIDEIAALRKFT